MTRITDQAREQGGLLSQEDLAEILMCDVRTIRRDIESLRQREIVIATGRTKRLIKEYEQIIEEYKKGNYNMKQLLSSEVHIENNIESWIIEYAEKMELPKN